MVRDGNTQNERHVSRYSWSYKLLSCCLSKPMEILMQNDKHPHLCWLSTFLYASLCSFPTAVTGRGQSLKLVAASTKTNLSYRFPIFETSATALCGTTGNNAYNIYIYISPLFQNGNHVGYFLLVKSRLLLVLLAKPGQIHDFICFYWLIHLRSGNQTWQWRIFYKWRRFWQENHLQIGELSLATFDDRRVSRLSPQLPCPPAVAVSPVEGNAPKPPSRRLPDGLIPMYNPSGRVKHCDLSRMGYWGTWNRNHYHTGAESITSWA
jgi:hypothetical protein